MSLSDQAMETGTAIINGQPVEPIRGVRLDGRSLEILLPGRAAIAIYVFTSRMFAIASKRNGTEEYVLDGPRLGFYHDTADVREGPFINHFISHLEVSVAYRSSEEACLNIRGEADLSKSSVDPYWYKGPTTGKWSFEVSFVHKIAWA